jgi:Ca2+/H+ antiporter, TMEM165/GDT1 family
MEAFVVSLLVVALAEIGDKTQILAMVLAAKLKKPLPIILGILCATAANHLLAAAGGYFLAEYLRGVWFRWIVAAGFLAMGVWTLFPDTLDETSQRKSGTGAFLTTLVCFFLVEIGDKTQIATVALAARFHGIIPVAMGTTAGMLLADIPAVFLAERATKIVPLKIIRWCTAALFIGLGVWAILDILVF